MAPPKGRKIKGDPPSKILNLMAKKSGAPVARQAAPSVPPSQSPPPARELKRLRRADGSPVAEVPGKGKEKVGGSARPQEPEVTRRIPEKAIELGGKAAKIIERPQGSPNDITYLGWDSLKFSSYRARDHPGRADILHQFACSKTPSYIREIQGDHVRRATEAVARAWTNPLERVAQDQGPADNIRHSIVQAANALVFAQQGLGQLNDMEEAARRNAATVRRLTEEKEKVGEKLNAQIARLNDQLKIALDTEKKQLEANQNLSAEVKAKVIALDEERKKRETAEQRAADLEAEVARLKESAKDMIPRAEFDVRLNEEMGSCSNLGYVCAYADCIRAVSDFDVPEIVESIGKDLTDFLETFPPRPGTMLQLGDMGDYGIKLDFLDPSIVLTRPSVGEEGVDGEHTGGEQTEPNEQTAAEEMVAGMLRDAPEEPNPNPSEQREG